MNYKYLANKELDKFFEETDFSVGDIIRAITLEKISGLKVTNRGIITEKSDKEWYEIIEKAYENEQ